jgi:hypothetical protein
VNVGGDPERDDHGLPPVDIVIPDDARELDRDVQAYQRELRALRRRQRSSRLRGPLTRDGMVLPMLAGCLILALITSTLLIMFAADQTGMPNLSGHVPAGASVPHRPAGATTQPTAGTIGGPLPPVVVVVNGRREPLLSLTAARPSVLALIPLSCQCGSVLRRLHTQAAEAHVALYLVDTAGDAKQVAELAAQAGQDLAQVADDAKNLLGETYHELGLTAILVRRGGIVASVTQDLSLPGRNLQTSLRQLGLAGQ